MCQLRINPNLPALNNATRLDGTPEYYAPTKDQRRIFEPGFDVGGPLWKNKLWAFLSYIPDFDSIHRTTTFTGRQSGTAYLVPNLPAAQHV